MNAGSNYESVVVIGVNRNKFGYMREHLGMCRVLDPSGSVKIPHCRQFAGKASQAVRNPQRLYAKLVFLQDTVQRECEMIKSDLMGDHESRSNNREPHMWLTRINGPKVEEFPSSKEEVCCLS